MYENRVFVCAVHLESVRMKPHSAARMHPWCHKCGWRKGGIDSWDGNKCKCGHSEPPYRECGSGYVNGVHVTYAEADNDASRVLAYWDSIAELAEIDPAHQDELIRDLAAVALSAERDLLITVIRLACARGHGAALLQVCGRHKREAERAAEMERTDE